LKTVGIFLQILAVNLSDFLYAVNYFYFTPFFVICLVSVFGQRDIDLDIKAIGVEGIKEIKLQDFVNNKVFFEYYAKVSNMQK
jgi:hypothetical protein